MNRRPLPRALLSGALGFVVLLSGCGPTPEEPATTGEPVAETGPSSSAEPSSSTEPASSSEPWFLELGADAGLDFVHFNGMDGRLLYSEMMGSGAALFDADNDGNLDAYLVQGAVLDGGDYDSATFPPAESRRPPRDRLFLNEGDDGSGLRFRDATDASGLAATGYGMGVVAFDADGDGWTDLYVTNSGRNQLWRNRSTAGEPRFEDVSQASGTDLDTWSVPAVPFDFDRDGRLDLFVGNYVNYRPSADKPCTDELGQPNYCGPLAYAPVADRLLHNLGPGPDGVPRFADVTRRAGLDAASPGACLGAIAADLDGDGWTDLYVANDGTPNHLWLNQGPGDDGQVIFREAAVLAGAAVSGQGHPEASMGLASADLDDDGDLDLFVTHLTKETNTLYLNDGQGFFSDRSDRSGLGAPSLPSTGFGTAFFDLENDGWLDVFVANGAVKIVKSQALAGDPHPLHQPNQLFRHRGESGTPRYEAVEGGPALAHSEVSRGVAMGDVDSDGDTDLLLSNNGGPARLLLNRRGADAAWIGLRLLETAEDSGATHDSHGARLRVVGSPDRWRRVDVAASYASSHDPRVLVGLGDRTAGPQTVEVHWPNGSREQWTDLSPGRYHTLVRGTSDATLSTQDSAESNP